MYTCSFKFAVAILIGSIKRIKGDTAYSKGNGQKYFFEQFEIFTAQQNESLFSKYNCLQ